MLNWIRKCENAVVFFLLQKGRNALATSEIRILPPASGMGNGKWRNGRYEIKLSLADRPKGRAVRVNYYQEIITVALWFHIVATRKKKKSETK